jgi:hypothetical protein
MTKRHKQGNLNTPAHSFIKIVGHRFSGNVASRFSFAITTAACEKQNPPTPQPNYHNIQP